MEHAQPISNTEIPHYHLQTLCPDVGRRGGRWVLVGAEADERWWVLMSVGRRWVGVGGRWALSGAGWLVGAGMYWALVGAGRWVRVGARNKGAVGAGRGGLGSWALKGRWALVGVGRWKMRWSAGAGAGCLALPGVVRRGGRLVLVGAEADECWWALKGRCALVSPCWWAAGRIM
ncbi:hypothetical protein CYMTET_31645 [Cymbomonas tetramitiformis]|uniref:Uncharacterized protein n=1 Tax=Cymbomonas tetramitiformis TaxID=36881 RepID=A0AAE0KSP0_9CHLO|nr:hypothetical protein CYMTET_31645 [Cymbomonas tetramitiformis]